MNLGTKIVAFGMIAGSFFGMGYGTRAYFPDKKPDYESNVPVEQGFYQDSTIDLTKEINKQGNLEIYVEGKEIKVPLRDDLILLNNEQAYDALEKRLLKEPKENRELIDKIFSNSYGLLLESYEGENVKQSCANPSYLEFKIKRDSDGVYAVVNNLKKNEELEIESIDKDIQLGNKEYRREITKKELGYDISEKYENFMEKAQKIIPWVKGMIGWE